MVALTARNYLCLVDFFVFLRKKNVRLMMAKNRNEARVSWKLHARRGTERGGERLLGADEG